METSLTAGQTSQKDQLHFDRVLCVDIHIDQALAHPKKNYRRGIVFRFADEVAEEEKRHYDLEERSAGDCDEMPEWGEDDVSRLVYGEIDHVEETPVHRFGRNVEKVQSEHRGECQLQIVGL